MAEKNLSGLMKHNEELNRYTRECICRALLEIMKEQEYKSITVTKICEKAGFSRMAFYANYSSKDDIMAEVIAALQDIIAKHVGSPFDKDVTREWYVRFFNTVKDNLFLINVLRRANMEQKYLDTVNDYLIKGDLSRSEKYKRLLWSGAIQNITLYWINNGLKESPEEMTELFTQYID